MVVFYADFIVVYPRFTKTFKQLKKREQKLAGDERKEKKPTFFIFETIFEQTSKEETRKYTLRKAKNEELKEKSAE